MDDVDQPVAIVTGSSSGIGERIARRLAALGTRVVVNSASSVAAGEAVSSALPTDSIYVRADVSDPDDAQALVDAAMDRFGRIDQLVNNAGWTVTVAHDDLDGLTDEIFRKTFEVNLFGTWWLTKHAIPHLQRSNDPCIVNITSIAGHRPVGSSMAYSMAKAAVNQMTMLLAKSYGPVRVNAVAPGLVSTPLTADWDVAHESVAATAPLRRVAMPDDVALAVTSLIQNPYVTGEILVIDGGLSLKI